MNYLQLCQRLRLEVGVSGDDSTVVGASGEWLRICTWINQAWIEIQQERDDWNWMRVEKTFNTIANQAEYDYDAAPLSLTNFARWLDGSFRIYYNNIGDEHLLQQMNYRAFRDEYLIGTHKTTYSYPSVITVSPSGSLILALPPNDVYTVTGEYFKDVSELSNNEDVPEFPERFHMLIVYQAMEDNGFFESASEVLQRSYKRYQRMLNKLLSDETPEVTVDRGFC